MLVILEAEGHAGGEGQLEDAVVLEVVGEVSAE